MSNFLSNASMILGVSQDRVEMKLIGHREVVATAKVLAQDCHWGTRTATVATVGEHHQYQDVAQLWPVVLGVPDFYYTSATVLRVRLQDLRL